MADRPGVVLQRDDVTILDTNAMPWEDHFYGGTKTKILTRFDDGAPMVQIEWIPAGLETFGDAPERHAHAVTERLLVFAGEFPIIEYEDFDDTVGERVVFKPAGISTGGRQRPRRRPVEAGAGRVPLHRVARGQELRG